MRLFLLSNDPGGAEAEHDASLLGAFNMPGVVPSAADSNGNTEELEYAVACLRKAIVSLDKARVPSDLAARVQEALDAILTYRNADGGR